MIRWLKRDLKIVEIVLVVLAIAAIAIRIALPDFLKTQVNRRLDRIPGYTGRVADVGVHLWHGGYSMHHFVIEKRGATGQEPFISADKITFTIAYRDLFHGRFTSDVVIVNGRINFRRAPNPEGSQNLGWESESGPGPPAPGKPWQDIVRDLFPVKITHLELRDSRIHYVNEVAQPKVDLIIEDLNLTANRLRNRPSKSDGPLPATITANGRTMGNGEIHVVIAAEPLAEQPHLNIKLAVENVWLPSLNAYLLQHAGVDVSKGVLQVYAEVTAADGNYEGYVKPILTDLDFNVRSDEQKSPIQLFWKDIVAGISRLMRDKEKKQVATLIPFSGNFAHSSNVDIGTTLRNLFHNGFVDAIHRGLEGSPSAKTEGPPR